LEHLEEPETAVRECYRIIKNGGHAIYAVPFIWHLHEEPRDFFRYTKYGLKYLFHKAGFEIVELKALSGFFVTFSQLLVYFLYSVHRGPMKYIPVIPAAGFGIQLIGLVLEIIYKTERWTWAYLLVARKNQHCSCNK
jgi:SAM-dependent methyltransferase